MHGFTIDPDWLLPLRPYLPHCSTSSCLLVGAHESWMCSAIEKYKRHLRKIQRVVVKRYLKVVDVGTIEYKEQGKHLNEKYRRCIYLCGILFS